MTRKGFTIIELLFVIAIIGVLISVGVSCTVKQTDNFKVKKTALQMQHILQAGMAYNNDNNKWPEGDSDRDAMTPPFNQTYIGPAIVGKGNPWGNKYEYVREPGMVNTFGIRTVTPNVATAQAVAALLPMAYTKDATVYAYVNQAGMNAPMGNMLIMGYVEKDLVTVAGNDNHLFTYTERVSCPTGMRASIIPIWGVLETGWMISTDAQYRSWKFKYHIGIEKKECDKNGNCEIGLRIYPEADVNNYQENHITVKFDYLTVCIK